MVLVEDFDEAAHVGALEIVGQIDEKIDRARGILLFAALVENLNGILYVFDPDFLKGNGPCVGSGLDVYHFIVRLPYSPQPLEY